MTTAEIIAIGDEILIGQILNTNAQWIASQVDSIGIKPIQFRSISDTKEAITGALDDALAKTDVIFMTGGLGPTKDDITKHTLVEYFETELVLNQPRLDELQLYYASKGRVLNKMNTSQAMFPKDCFMINNEVGTASSMWFTTKEGKIVISMPGVPYEMKDMMTKVILPKLIEEVTQTPILHRTLKTFGVPESDLAEIIEDWEERLPEFIKLAYLPNIGSVRLRLSGAHLHKELLKQTIDEQVEQLYHLIGQHIYGEEKDELETVLGELLTEKKLTISTAESCTGGGIAQKIVTVPGSSAYFKGSVVAYSNEVKIEQLGVSNNTIDTYGAVSEECVVQMALGVAAKMKTDLGISVSGIAGPGGGTEEKPVGTVWMAVSIRGQVFTQKKFMFYQRDRNMHLAVLYALDFARREIIKSGL